MPDDKDCDTQTALVASRIRLKKIFHHKCWGRPDALPPMEDKDIGEREKLAAEALEILERVPSLAAETHDLYVPLVYFLHSDLDESTLERLYQVCPEIVHQKLAKAEGYSFFHMRRWGSLSNESILWLASKFDRTTFATPQSRGKGEAKLKAALLPLFGLLYIKHNKGQILSLEVIKVFLEKYSAYDQDGATLLDYLLVLGYPGDVVEYVVSKCPERLIETIKLDSYQTLPILKNYKMNMLREDQARALCTILPLAKALVLKLSGPIYGNGWSRLLHTLVTGPLDNLQRLEVKLSMSTISNYDSYEPKIVDAVAYFVKTKPPSAKLVLCLEEGKDRCFVAGGPSIAQFFRALFEGMQENPNLKTVIDEFSCSTFAPIKLVNFMASFQCRNVFRGLQVQVPNDQTELIPSFTTTSANDKATLIGEYRFWWALGLLGLHGRDCYDVSATFRHDVIRPSVGQRITRQQSLTSLKIDFNEEIDKEITACLQQLVKIPSLKELHVHSASSGARVNGTALSQTMLENNGLETLEFVGMSFTDANDVPSSFLKVVKAQNCSLKKISIWGDGKVFVDGTAFSTGAPPYNFVNLDDSLRVRYTLAMRRFGIQKLHEASNSLELKEYVKALEKVRKAREAQWETTNQQQDLDSVNIFFCFLMALPGVWSSATGCAPTRKRKRE